MLAVRSLKFNFGVNPILRDIDFNCNEGEVVGIVGASGSGKTTLLNLICGLLRLQFGEILINGNTPVHAARSQQIGYVFQTPSLFPWLNIQDNTTLPLRLRKGNFISNLVERFLKRESDDIDEEHVTEKALRQSHILEAAKKFPADLSGGMQTRSAIARTIVYRPRLLLLDEPFSSLDDIVKERLYTELQEVIREIRCSTVLVTHDLAEAVYLCDRVYVLKKQGDEAATFVNCEMVNLPRPRTSELYGHPAFLKARLSIREGLV